uniref:Telomere-associated protein Rif1 N-terminal domain-containing protein n=1 Tax=Mycena chlorophos TaxID=658473 RepID=A0ABQ0LBK0_MYCCL|nr:predicted protein [Mycena chlorophos]
MDGVQAALFALAAVTSKSKKEHICSAVDQPNSVFRLLGLSSSSRVLDQISGIFDDGLKTLYDAFPEHTMQFSAAVLRAIVEVKVPVAKERRTLYEWENVQKSVVSSALVRLSRLSLATGTNTEQDALDANPTDKMKSIVANTLYGTIRDLYYTNGPAVEVMNHNLIFNVNLLLTESARNHAENQSQLRSDRVLGANRLAATILSSRDYFVLDSVFSLLGAILPNSKLAAQKRVSFIDSVFPPSKFSCSGQIKGRINAPDENWDDIIAKVINECLATIDISYPQPFVIENLEASASLPKFLDPLYVDKNAFFANVEISDDTMDSCMIPFLTVLRVTLSGASTTSVTVAMDLSAAPTIGAHNPFLLSNSAKTHTFSFKIKTSDRGRFMKTLRARGLGDRLSDGVDRKVSKLAEDVTLEFPTRVEATKEERATQIQERAAKVQELWRSNGEDLMADDEPTSPPVGSPTRSDRQSKTPAASSDDAVRSQLEEAAFGGELSDIEDPEPALEPEPEPKVKAKAKAKMQVASSSPPSTTQKSKGKRKARFVDSDAEDGHLGEDAKVVADAKASAKQPASRAENQMRTSKVQGVVLSPASSSPAEDENDSDFEPTQDKPPPARGTRVTRGTTSTKKPESAVRQSAQGKENKVAERQDKDIKSVVKPGEKRAREEEDDADDDHVAEDPRPPSKRQRRKDDAASEDPPKATTRRDSDALFATRAAPPAKKRYGKKAGRTSSPERAEDMVIDFDEPPGAVSTKSTTKAKPHVEPERTTRRAAMRGKGGQKPERVEPIAKPKVAVKDQKAKDDDSTEKAQSKRTSVRLSKAALLVEEEDDEPIVVVAKPKPKPKPIKSKKALQEDVPMDVQAIDEDSPKPKPKTSKQVPKEDEPTEIEPVIEVKPKQKHRVPPREDNLIVKNQDDKPQPKAKPVKPKKAPWEDMHLRTDPATSDVASLAPQPPEPIPAYEEYSEPIKGSSASSDPIEPAEIEVPMAVDVPEPPSSAPELIPMDDIPVEDRSVPLQTVLSPVASAPVLSPAPPEVPISNSARSVAPALHPSPVVPLPVPAQVPVRALPVQIVVETKPSRPVITVTPSNPPEPAPLLPKFKFHTAIMPAKYDTPAAVPVPKLPSLFKQPIDLAPAETHSSPAPRVVHRDSPAPVQRRFDVNPAPNDSPFPERVVPQQQVTFAVSPTPEQHHSYSYSHRGRPSHRYVEDEKMRGKKRGRSQSPMQAILDTLNDINEVIADKIVRRFDGVRHDVLVGRDKLLKDCVAALEAHCVAGERHFNVLVDIEDEYATFHRKVIAGMVETEQVSEIMLKACVGVLQQHDRHTLAKKLPTGGIFVVPSALRNVSLKL